MKPTPKRKVPVKWQAFFSKHPTKQAMIRYHTLRKVWSDHSNMYPSLSTKEKEILLDLYNLAAVAIGKDPIETIDEEE